MKTNETWAEKARRSIASDNAATMELSVLLGMGHTRSGASGYLYRQANGSGVRSFNKAVKSWAA